MVTVMAAPSATAMSADLQFAASFEEVAGQSDAKLDTISQGPHKSMLWD